MSIRKKISTAASLVLLLALVACTSNSSGGASNGTADPQASGATKEAAGNNKDKVTIRVMTRWTGTDSYTAVWQAAQKEYMEKNPNVTIVDESINEETAYQNKFKAGLATGDLPAVFGDQSLLVDVGYAKNNVISDLSQDFATDQEWSGGFNESVLNNGKFDAYGVKGYYGVPVANGIEVMYYNTDLFSKAGITKTPDTYEELLEDINKLKTSGTTPWLVGAKDTWRTGHIHNGIFYKSVGLNKAIDLGARKAKWTDADVVETFKYIKDLKAMGAFEKNLEGVDYETEKAQFLAGAGAMVFNGTWFMGDVEKSALKDKIKVFLFPSMKDKPQFKDENIAYPQMLLVNKKLSTDERMHAIGFLKLFTSKSYQERLAYESKNLPARKDVNLDVSKTGELFNQVLALSNQVKVAGPDTFALDPLSSMQDRTRNSIIGVLLDQTPEQATKDIQAEIDKSGK